MVHVKLCYPLTVPYVPPSVTAIITSHVTSCHVSCHEATLLVTPHATNHTSFLSRQWPSRLSRPCRAENLMLRTFQSQLRKLFSSFFLHRSTRSLLW